MHTHSDFTQVNWYVKLRKNSDFFKNKHMLEELKDGRFFNIVVHDKIDNKLPFLISFPAVDSFGRAIQQREWISYKDIDPDFPFLKDEMDVLLYEMGIEE